LFVAVEVKPVARIPERFGSFRLIKPIGSGQICTVWEVERAGSTEREAMKLILAGERHTKANIAGLKHEFQIGKQLDNPFVISTREFFTGPNGSYMVQELFRSVNMKELLRQGVESYAANVDRIIREAAAGLAYIHSQGWVHRDVKPDNFLVNEEGNVKLIDFNIAQKRQGWLGKLLPSRTKVQGTQSYMSPEQIRGGAITESSDIYSFGCTIHELVCGKAPFTGSTTTELLNKHLRTKPPSLTAVGENVRSDFAKLLLTLMEKEPAARPASMQQFIDDLGEIKAFTKLG
jgi:eukaryotic-like serine/threonine-protein kinase